MHEVKYFIGKFDKDTNKQELSNTYFVSQIIKQLGECTILRSKSGYINQKGKQISESLLVVIQLLNDDNVMVNTTALENCKHFKKLFNQEAILFTIEEVKYEVC